jgi:hypothetical protein
MSGVYTNLAKKRIEQSQKASHAPQKESEPLNQIVDKKRASTRRKRSFTSGIV